MYLGQTYTYTVTFKQFGSCLIGTLTDPYFPVTGPVSGTINRNHVTFTFRYPQGSVQVFRDRVPARRDPLDAHLPVRVLRHVRRPFSQAVYPERFRSVSEQNAAAGATMPV